MGRVRVTMLAAAAALVSTAAAAADLPPIMQPPMKAPVEEFAGWYLRGDIGVSNQEVGSLYNVLYDLNAVSVQNVQKGFDAAPIFGLGIGYQWNNWLRVDVTGEYRAKANFHGLDIARDTAGTLFPDEYHASKSEWVFLANAYFDLGTWWHITPFVGAGVGMSYNRIHDFKDVGTTVGSVAFGDTTGKWNFAWALHAGLAYAVTHDFTVELAYRYIDLGDAQSGDLRTYDGINSVNNPMHFRDITSHDMKLGVRWSLEPSYMPPLVRKG
jgi:opacity protein-like surface antigen